MYEAPEVLGSFDAKALLGEALGHHHHHDSGGSAIWDN